MNKREFLMLAKDYEPGQDVSGWFMSEKLDGQRAFWDGGISHGLDARDVPYANTAKDGRFVDRPIATGLWSRYGKVIHAPDWWLADLPTGINLDLELWMGRGTFQTLRSIVGSLDKGEGWRKVKGYAIDAPGWPVVLKNGELTGTNWKGFLDHSMLTWVEAAASTAFARHGSNLPYGIVAPFTGFGQPEECFRTLAELRLKMPELGRVWEPMTQQRLPSDTEAARKMVDEKLHEVSSAKGEGLILRNPTSPWVAKRVPWVLKVKKLSDAEGTVVGFTWGRQTDLGSKLLGKMGALILKTKPGSKEVRLELSGFTDEERSVHGGGETLVIDGKTVWAEGVYKEGEEASDAFTLSHFPFGSQVTYTYRELTNDGIPKEARYLRKRDE